MKFDPSDPRAVHVNWWYCVLDKEMPWTTLFWKSVGKKKLETSQWAWTFKWMMVRDPWHLPDYLMWVKLRSSCLFLPSFPSLPSVLSFPTFQILLISLLLRLCKDQFRNAGKSNWQICSSSQWDLFFLAAHLSRLVSSICHPLSSETLLWVEWWELLFSTSNFFLQLVLISHFSFFCFFAFLDKHMDL